MYSKPNFTNNSRKSYNWLLPVLALALTVPARGETPPPAIPFSDIGARATANYQGDFLGITATADGARLRCGFQKLEGHTTPQGLWLESTRPDGGQLRLVAVAVGRGGTRARPCALTEAASSVRSAMSIVTVPQGDQAPLGATCTYGAASWLDMPLLADLETAFSDMPCSALGLAGLSTLNSQPSTILAATGQVSVHEKLVRFTRPGVTEEYSVSVDGVRQDFIIESPPLNPPPSTLNQSMRVELALSGARAEATASGAMLTLEGSGRVLAYSRLRVEDATGRELTARLEVLSPDRLTVSVPDANAIYPVRIDPTFSDADWVSLNSGVPGANGQVLAIVVDDSGNVCVGGGFTIIGTVLANHIAKWDGSAWSALGSGMDYAVWALAVSGTNLYAGGYFAGAGGVPANCIAKWDGNAWSVLGSGIGGGHVYALAASGTNLYAGGYFTTAGGVTATNIAKWDGSAWSALGSGMNSDVDALAVSGTDLYAGGHFTTAGGVTANYIAKWDGSAWSPLGSGMGGYPFTVSALAVSGTILYAGGAFTTAGGVLVNYIAKWDGSAWSALGSGMGGSNPYVYALAVSGTHLYAGGGFTTAGGVTANNIAKWDGNVWSALGLGMNNYQVSALAVSGTNLYAGGNFTVAGGVTAKNVARWDGSAWSAFGQGMGYVGGDPYVSALAVSGTNLYAGGEFTTASGAPANGIAKWNGSAWSALGSGMGGSYLTVSALAASGTKLYAGGWFTTAGGVTANGIAQWDGKAWSALGSGMSGAASVVHALAVIGTDLYAGGNFTMAGGVAATNIAKWDGSAWSALGSGIGGSSPYNSAVLALAVIGTDLYAGGLFTTAGGVAAPNIAKWDGHAWSALGSGMNISGRTLAASGTNLYAGGESANWGGYAYVAKWDGSAWSALGGGMETSSSSGPTPLLYALAVSGTNLYVGGEFTRVDGYSVRYIAQGDVGGSGWGSLGSGMNDSVYALAADGAGHLFVGGRFSLAGGHVACAIAQANVGSAPTVLAAPQTQTAEAGAMVRLAVNAVGEPPPAYQWYFNGTNLLSCASSNLVLTNILFSQSGTYTVVAINDSGAVTSAPVMVNVIPPVEHRLAAGVQVMGEAGSLLNLDYANSLSATPNWLPLHTVSLVSTSQYCFDVSQPLPPQRYYRAWQTGIPGILPSLSLVGIAPAITLTGTIGHSVRLDYINQFGPTDAWVTLATVPLTNTSQLYFDTSARGQPGRLYRVVPLP
jgi:hypothetical protein